MSTRLLCVGDIHLGRRPAGLSEAASDRVAVRETTPAAAWRRVVEEALRREVDAVLLAGDVVDQRDDFYEAYGSLHAGVFRLTEAGIPVIGVAGNHDGLVLPRLADAIAGFRLLGRGGRWEEAWVDGRSGPRTRVLGWSFPGQTAGTDPLADLPRVEPAGGPTLGLLHCDRDSSGSRYAPVRSSALEAAPTDGWLLGHIHKPDPLRGPRPIGYLGALTALDPSDEGPRGPWLVDVDGSGAVGVEQLPLAPLRFQRFDLDVTTLTRAEDLSGLVLRSLDRLHAEISDSEHRPLAVGMRFRLTGRTSFRGALDAERARLPELVVIRDETVYFVNRTANDALPVRDLAEIAEGGRDPYSLLARRILLLERDADDPERQRLIAGARARLERVRSGPVYGHLDPPRLDDESIRDLLRSAALAAMDQLEERREAGA